MMTIEPARSRSVTRAGPDGPTGGEARRQPCRVVPFPQRDGPLRRGSAEAEAAQRTWMTETLRDVCLSGLAVWALILCAMAFLT